MLATMSVTTVSPTELYNIMNDGQLSPYEFDPSVVLLVDVRDLTEYNKSHIVTAVSFRLVHEPLLRKLDWHYDRVVYYDQGTITNQTLEEVASSMPPSITYDTALSLNGGFEDFHMVFPFLCTEKPCATGPNGLNLLGKYPSVILEHTLYLGKGDQATKVPIVKNLGITHIINISLEFDCPHSQCSYLHLKLADDLDTNLLDEFDKTNKFIASALSSNGRVFVHCSLGASRSATVVIAYLMYANRWKLAAAFEYVTRRRPVVKANLNPSFYKQLQKYEDILFHSG